MGNVASAGLEDKKPHDERDITSLGNEVSRPRPNGTDTEAPDRKLHLLESYRDIVPKFPSSYISTKFSGRNGITITGRPYIASRLQHLYEARHLLETRHLFEHGPPNPALYSRPGIYLGPGVQ